MLACLRVGSVSAETVGLGEVSGVTHPQGAVHMVAARFACERAMAGTG